MAISTVGSAPRHDRIKLPNVGCAATWWMGHHHPCRTVLAVTIHRLIFRCALGDAVGTETKTFRFVAVSVSVIRMLRHLTSDARGIYEGVISAGYPFVEIGRSFPTKDGHGIDRAGFPRGKQRSRQSSCHKNRNAQPDRPGISRTRLIEQAAHPVCG